MEIILVTPNPKYQSLVSATKIIESSNVDIVSIIQTEVFLNHHYNISFYCIRNNFPYQFHCPLKISKLLLERNQGSVQLSISNGLNFNIQADTDTLEILLKIQNSLQGSESQQNVMFTLKYWQIHIRLIVMNQVYEQVKIKQLVETIQQTRIQNISQNIQSTTQYQIQQISKLIVYIDDNNYEQFLSWCQSQSIHFNYQINEKLSNQYMSLKQEIDNQKNSFRNKIKMVEAILGENINIDKLLSQQKQQNQEYKRLRETFQTIKNIDNVLIEQEKKLQLKTLQLKQKRSQKHRVHYENAKKFAKTKYQISAILKEIQQLKYKCECVRANKAQYESRRNFQPNAKIKDMLVQQQKRCKNMIKNVCSFYQQPNKQQSQILNKRRTIQSLHKNEKKYQENYQNLLKAKVKKYRLQKENKNSFSLKDKLNEQTQKYENILFRMAKYYEKNYSLICQMKNKGVRSSNSNYSSLKEKEKAETPKKISFIKKQRIFNIDSYQKTIDFNESRGSMIEKSLATPKNKWIEQFVVLKQLLENNPRSYNFNVKNNNQGSVSFTNKVQSNLSIKYGYPEENKQKDKEKEKEKEKQNQKVKEQKIIKIQKSSIMTKNKQYKTKLKTKFDPEIKKKEKSQLDPQEQKSTITFK